MTEAADVDEALVFECDLDAPVGKVWRALAVPELRAAWLGEAESAACRVLEAETGTRLTVGWLDEGRESTVTFEIAENDLGGAHLRIVHSSVAPTARIIAFPARAADRTTMTACAAFRKAA